MVDVRALLTVNFDAYEVLVHQAGDVLVLEAFPLHDVTPVAGRVAYAEQDRLVLAAGLGERLIAPGIPVHRIVGVLEQVGAALSGQPISVGFGHGLF